MLRLSDNSILNLYGWSSQRNPVEIAVGLIKLTYPELADESIWDIPIGKRNRALFEIRDVNLGPKIRMHLKCPNCKTELELTMTTGDFLNQEVPDYSLGFEFEFEGERFNCRFPTSADLLALFSSVHPKQFQLNLLKQTCNSSLPAIVSQDLIDSWSVKLNDLDPLLDIGIRTDCDSCGMNWRSQFEIVQFLIQEFKSRAKRILQEIDLLARVYSWSEQSILALDPMRRKWYVEMSLR